MMRIGYLSQFNPYMFIYVYPYSFYRIKISSMKITKLVKFTTEKQLEKNRKDIKPVNLTHTPTHTLRKQYTYIKMRMGNCFQRNTNEL